MTKELRRDLGEGLILRQATAEDTEAAAEFQAQVHLPHTFAESFRIWTRDLMSGALPGFQPGDFTVVDDTRSGAIVSMLNLIPQTWSFGGIEISVGRIELVSTHPDYRKRGLVRAQIPSWRLALWRPRLASRWDSSCISGVSGTVNPAFFSTS